MNDREKLIELLKEAYCSVTSGFGDEEKAKWLLELDIEVNWEDIADHLIANGVVIRKQGEWIGDRCSRCRESYMDYADADSNPAMGEPKPNYCPNCGAKMKEVTNEVQKETNNH